MGVGVGRTISLMAAVRQCNVCSSPDTFGPDSESAAVRSNIRKFRDESFTVWRCGSCRSLHAGDDVDLDHYYASYPFHNQQLNWPLRAAYRNLLGRLTRAGLRRSHKVLDHGCGSGLLVNFMVRKGFARAVGYDAYSEQFRAPALLEDKYDCIVSQDVLEHVHKPRELLDTYAALANPGAVIAIGTPDADAIDLSHVETHIHALHQPYHTHMLSKGALFTAARDLGWSLERFYPSSYVNTLVPLVNFNFGQYYGNCFDNTLDLAFEKLKVSRKLLTPRALWLAFFGYFNCPTSDIMAIFRTPPSK